MATLNTDTPVIIGQFLGGATLAITVTSTGADLTGLYINARKVRSSDYVVIANSDGDYAAVGAILGSTTSNGQTSPYNLRAGASATIYIDAGQYLDIQVSATSAGGAAVCVTTPIVGIIRGANGLVTGIQDATGLSNFSQKPRRLAKWSAAYAAAVVGIAPAILMKIGDSTSMETGAGTGASGLIGAHGKGQYGAAGRRLARISGMPVYQASIIGDQGATGVGGTLTYPQYDPRVVLPAAGGWATNTLQTLGNQAFYAAGATTADFTFTPVESFDSFYVCTAGTSATSTAVTIKVDNVSVGTINTTLGGAASYTKTKFTCASGTHTIGVSNAAAGCYITGIYCWNSATPGIVFLQAARYGSIIADWNSSSAWAPLPAIGVIAPHLSIINLSINDTEAVTSLSTYMSNFTALVAKCQISGDVVVHCGTPSSGTGTTNGYLDALIAATAALGNTMGFDVYDIRDLLGSSYAAANASGLMWDVKHPLPAGHALIGGKDADLAALPA